MPTNSAAAVSRALRHIREFGEDHSQPTAIDPAPEAQETTAQEAPGEAAAIAVDVDHADVDLHGQARQSAVARALLQTAKSQPAPKPSSAASQLLKCMECMRPGAKNAGYQEANGAEGQPGKWVGPKCDRDE